MGEMTAITQQEKRMAKAKPRAEPIAKPTAQLKAKPTPLFEFHQSYEARFVDFANHRLPVQYKDGILAEHLHTRAHASLFDVSHMGQARLYGSAKRLEAVFPADLINMAIGQMRYNFLLNDLGGIMDDLMIIRLGEEEWHIIVNGACRDKDFAFLQERVDLALLPDLALLALQGPFASSVMAQLDPQMADLPFMTARSVELLGMKILISRSGYTGEDGYEIALSSDEAMSFARALLEYAPVKMAGLGARDSLRLEAGLCLYGQDIDETITPIEAGLTWAISKRRRALGGFPGYKKIAAQLSDGCTHSRIGFAIEGKRPARSGAEIIANDDEPIGYITSGLVAASQPDPIAMGYIQKQYIQNNEPSPVFTLRQKTSAVKARIVPLPFRRHRYFSKNNHLTISKEV